MEPMRAKAEAVPKAVVLEKLSIFNFLGHTVFCINVYVPKWCWEKFFGNRITTTEGHHTSHISNPTKNNHRPLFFHTIM